MDQITARLADALRAIVGTKPEKYGYFAAAEAMDDTKRAEALAALTAYDATSGIALEFKLTTLQGEVDRLRNLVSRSINTLEQVQVALDEDDVEKAQQILKDALGQEDRDPG